jgi:hypothetical protein
MMKEPVRFALVAALCLLLSCKQKQVVDALYYNATFYTVNKDDDVAEALVIDQGKIIFAGKKEDALLRFSANAMVDLNGRFVYPGFIDAHCHFVDYGLHLSQLDLVGTNSWQEVISRLKKYALTHPEGWIVGRGWDQNDWKEKEYPTNEELNKLFPDQPVYLKRIDGHACIANRKALEMAGISEDQKISGGELLKQNGSLTGVLIDNAMDSLEKNVPVPTIQQLEEAVIRIEQQCFEVGLTTVDDAGLTRAKIEAVDRLQLEGKLKIRVYAMVADDDSSKQHYFSRGPYKTERLNVRSVKYYSDGAMGSRGAMLLKPYSDATRSTGLSIHPPDYFLEQAKRCYDAGFQMCTHAIGDSANRMMLNIYGKVLGGLNDRRWRIEHCQVIAPDDFELFHRYSIVPSVQATHATSDMYWAIDRLGVYRVKGAYAYRDLMRESGWIANGSDFPVEDINPLYGFYAAVARKDQKGFPEKGFQPENALTREEALRAMTIWAAQANFEEHEKGSLEPGKFADFVVLEKDIMKIPIEETFRVKVLNTYVNGEKVH